MKSPFKFLDAYTVRDKEFFFGREEEVHTLYSQIFKTPLMLLYGLSGTGKTSIIQCGLANKFDGPDWYPFFIRRNTNINISTKLALESSLQEDATDSLTGNVSILLKKYLRPVYLIFDQFEELFILGSKAEQDEFMESIEELLNANLPCKIMFVMREEYIAQLYPYEKKIPSLFDFRLRIERMGITKVKEVITSSFEHFNIKVEAPEEENVQLMVDNISDERTGIALPYLQVYLDLLYREAYKRQKPEPVESGFPKLIITKQLIDDLGKIEHVLRRFLADQDRSISRDMAQKFPELPENIVSAILSGFVTQDGTKRPITYFRDEGMIKLSDADAQFFPKIPKNALTHCLEQLEHARLIRIDDDDIELAHDSLAALIDARRTDEERRLQEVHQRIVNSFQEYQQSKAYLNEKQLNAVEDLLPLLNLNPEILSFVDASKENILRKRLEAEEMLRKEREADLVQQKLDTEKKARKKEKKLLWLLSLITLLALGAGGYAAYLSSEAHTQKEIAVMHRNDAVERGNELKNQSDSINNILKENELVINIIDSVKSGLLNTSDLSKVLASLNSVGIGKNMVVDVENSASLSQPTNYFITAATGSRNNPGPSMTKFRTNQVINVFGRINSPKTETVVVKWFDEENNLYGSPMYFDLGVNAVPDPGYRISGGRGANRQGVFSVKLFNGAGQNLKTIKVTIQD